MTEDSAQGTTYESRIHRFASSAPRGPEASLEDEGLLYEAEVARLSCQLIQQ